MSNKAFRCWIVSYSPSRLHTVVFLVSVMTKSLFEFLPREIRRCIFEYLVITKFGFIENNSFRDLISVRSTCRALREEVSNLHISLKLEVFLDISPRYQAVYYQSDCETEREPISVDILNAVACETNWKCNYLKIELDVVAGTVDDIYPRGMPKQFEPFFETLARLCEDSVEHFALRGFRPIDEMLMQHIFDRLIHNNCFVANVEICIDMKELETFECLNEIAPSNYCQNVVKAGFSKSYFTNSTEAPFRSLHHKFPSLKTFGTELVRSLSVLSPLTRLSRLELESIPQTSLPPSCQLSSIRTVIVHNQQGNVNNLPQVISQCFPNLNYLHLLPKNESAKIWNTYDFGDLPPSCEVLCTRYSILGCFRNCTRLAKVRVMLAFEDGVDISDSDLSSFKWNLELFTATFMTSELDRYVAPFIRFCMRQLQLKVLSINIVPRFGDDVVRDFVIPFQVELYNHPSIRYLRIHTVELINRRLDSALDSWILSMQEKVDVYPLWDIRGSQFRSRLLIER